MKRDIDLQRKILLFIEEWSPPQGGLDMPVEILGYDQATILAHVELLIEGNYIDGNMVQTMAGPIGATINKLTNRGHDAIAAAKNDTLWQKAKKSAIDHGIPLTLNAVVEIVKAEARIHLGLP